MTVELMNVGFSEQAVFFTLCHDFGMHFHFISLWVL